MVVHLFKECPFFEALWSKMWTVQAMPVHRNVFSFDDISDWWNAMLPSESKEKK
jgi:hypothetical protein